MFPVVTPVVTPAFCISV